MRQINLYEEKHLEKELVEFSFMRRTSKLEIGSGEEIKINNRKIHVVEVKGIKTLKLFKSWFRLMKNFKYWTKKPNTLLYGTLKFVSTGETWIWQNPNLNYNVGKSGWRLAIKPKQ